MDVSTGPACPARRTRSCWVLVPYFGLTLFEYFPVAVLCTLTNSRHIIQQGINDEACVICWETLELGSRCRKLPCGHVFHQICVDLWMMIYDASCPLRPYEIL
ncbi:hypothetical protein V1522DRAFT_416907 [Lipomyces starkeyi]